MASGVCPVAYDYAAAAEVIRDLGNGASVACGDEEGFIARAVQMAGADALRAELARAARHSAEAIDWERVNDHFAAALLRVWRVGSGLPVELSEPRPEEA